MSADEQLQVRVHGDAGRPTLVYLPGLHGDWTLVSSFRAAIAGQVRFVEFTYPRTLTWSLVDYARAVEGALLSHGVRRGWVLGESFGSQVAWVLCDGVKREAGSGLTESQWRARPESSPAGSSRDEAAPGGAAPGDRFQAEGLILAGGFVRHPIPWGVRLVRRLCRGASLTWLTGFLFVYAKYAWLRHRRAPETLASIAEFIARRTELDRQAIVHRLTLIHDDDLRPTASRVTLPVHALNGLIDPIVPWWLVRPWLWRHCPGYRGGRTIGLADHNVLGTAPRTAAEQVRAWIAPG